MLYLGPVVSEEHLVYHFILFLGIKWIPYDIDL